MRDSTIPMHRNSEQLDEDLTTSRQVRRRSRRVRRYLAPGLVLLAGVCLSFTLFSVAYRSERRRIERDFERAVADRVSAVKQELELHRLILKSLASFYVASYSVEREEFRDFVAPLLASCPDIHALEWIPCVEESQRLQYEAAARQEGLSNFQFAERAKQGHMVRAGSRAEYFPVYYVEPYKGNELALGFDMASNPTRLETLNRSRQTGQTVATGRIKLVQETGDEFGFLVFKPVYRKGLPTETIEDRRENVQGFVLGIFHVGVFMEKALGQLSPAGIDIYLYDRSAPVGKQFLYLHASRLRTAPLVLGALGQLDLQTGLHKAVTLDVSGRQWWILCKASPSFITSRETWHPWGGLVGGLVFSGLFAAYVLSIIVRKARTEQLASKLLEANQRLEKEIEERRVTEEALRKSQASLAEAQEIAHLGNWDWNIVTNELWWSDEIYRIFRLQPQEFEATYEAFLNFVHSDDRDYVKKSVHEALHQNKLHNVDHRILLPNGDVRVVHEDGEVTFDESGRPTRMVGTVQDVTERKLAEEELQKAKEAAEAASQAKSEFLTNMSHEIRTPLTAILGFMDLLADSSHTPLERQKWLRIIRSNGEHLLTLINNILDISKIEAEKLPFYLERCDIAAIVRRGVDMMRVPAEQRGLSLSAEYEDELPETILADEARLQQVLVNLVGNAIKFTEAGGVTVTTTFLAHGCDGEPAVKIEVIDTGVGMAPEELEHISEPFYQVDGSVSRKRGGTGLGLAITRHIIEMMNGKLTIDSAPGEGSTFAVTIPTGCLEGVRMREPPAEEIRTEPVLSRQWLSGEKTLAGLRILLAEDGPENQLLISTVLRKSGAEVEIAENGRVAVKMAGAEPFDVVLMDMQMPHMDGYEAARILRNRGLTCPILALTAHAMSGDRERCLASGCTGYLSKPIDRGQLIAAVAQCAGRTVATSDKGRPDRPHLKHSDGEIIQSEFADDPDLAEIIDELVGALADKIEAMRQALENGHFEKLQRLAHQLKGAGGSYGYPLVTEASRVVELAAKAGDVEGAGMSLNDLAAICRAIVRGRAVSVTSKEVVE